MFPDANTLAVVNAFDGVATLPVSVIVLPIFERLSVLAYRLPTVSAFDTDALPVMANVV